MKLFYDGNNPQQYNNIVDGFTSNASFAGRSGYLNYIDYIQNYLKYTNNLPCSFQVISDNDEEIYRQGKLISSISDTIFVKIPIIKSDGSYNIKVINRLIENNIKINITSLYTIEHIDTIYSSIAKKNYMILSIFAGSIMDAGLDPIETVKYAIKLYKELSNIQILWAGCQTNLDINKAKNIDCHIITIPDLIISKINRLNVDLNTLAKDRVSRFLSDAEKLVI